MVWTGEPCGEWLRAPGDPAGAVLIEVMVDEATTTTQHRVGLLDVIGRASPVSVWDTPSLAAGVLATVTRSYTDGTDLYNLIRTAPVLLWQGRRTLGASASLVRRHRPLRVPPPVRRHQLRRIPRMGDLLRRGRRTAGAVMNPVTPEFLAALRGSHRMIGEVDVQQFGQIIVSGLQVVDGSVTLDAGAATYGQCEITTTYPGRFPIESGQFGMELAIRRGIAGHRATPELVPLGVFKIVGFDLDGNRGELRLTGMDRSKYALDARLEDDLTVDAATPVLDVIASLIATAVPHAPRDLPTGSYTVPEVVFETKTPPWEAVQQLAASIGKQPRFDGFGTFRLVDVNAPVGAPVWTIDEGPTGVLVSASMSATDDQIFNRIIAASPPDDTGVVYRGVATDETSSARYGGPFGRKPDWIESDLFTSDAMAAEAARARLESGQGASRSVSFSAPCRTVPSSRATSSCYATGCSASTPNTSSRS